MWALCIHWVFALRIVLWSLKSVILLAYVYNREVCISSILEGIDIDEATTNCVVGSVLSKISGACGWATISSKIGASIAHFEIVMVCMKQLVGPMACI